MNHFTAVILAAGKGTRMKSERPKVLHEVAGRAMLDHVLAAAEEAGASRRLVVIGYGGERVAQAVAGRGRGVAARAGIKVDLHIDHGNGRAVHQPDARAAGVRPVLYRQQRPGVLQAKQGSSAYQ